MSRFAFCITIIAAPFRRNTDIEPAWKSTGERGYLRAPPRRRRRVDGVGRPTLAFRAASEPGTIPRYSPSKPVARACSAQFLPACAWFLRFSNGHTTQNPINAQPPLEKNCPTGVDA